MGSRYVVISLLFFLVAPQLWSEPSQPGVKKLSYPDFPGTYFPQTDWHLPEAITSSVEAHLIDRLGKDFFHRLALKGYQIIDKATYLKEHPLETTAPTYSIIVSFSLPSMGIDEYDATLQVDDKGRVLKEIDIPELAAHPEKAIIVSLNQAQTEAVKSGYKPPFASPCPAVADLNSVRFLYVKGDWFWRFQSGPSAITRLHGTFHYYDVSPSTGKVFRIGDGIWDADLPAPAK
jgi:hypothetical protein